MSKQLLRSNTQRIFFSLILLLMPIYIQSMDQNQVVDYASLSTEKMSEPASGSSGEESEKKKIDEIFREKTNNYTYISSRWLDPNHEEAFMRAKKKVGEAGGIYAIEASNGLLGCVVRYYYNKETKKWAQEPSLHTRLKSTLDKVLIW
jgi:hypothetical protein